MSDFEKERLSSEPTPEQPPLSQREIFSRLARLNHELGWDLEEGDIDDLKGADDGDLLGNLMTLALEHGIDPDEFFEVLGIETEEQTVENKVDTE